MTAPVKIGPWPGQQGSYSAPTIATSGVLAGDLLRVAGAGYSTGDLHTNDLTAWLSGMGWTVTQQSVHYASGYTIWTWSATRLATASDATAQAFSFPYTAIMPYFDVWMWGWRGVDSTAPVGQSNKVDYTTGNTGTSPVVSASSLDCVCEGVWVEAGSAASAPSIPGGMSDLGSYADTGYGFGVRAASAAVTAIGNQPQYTATFGETFSGASLGSVHSLIVYGPASAADPPRTASLALFESGDTFQATATAKPAAQAIAGERSDSASAAAATTLSLQGALSDRDALSAASDVAASSQAALSEPSDALSATSSATQQAAVASAALLEAPDALAASASATSLAQGALAESDSFSGDSAAVLAAQSALLDADTAASAAHGTAHAAAALTDGDTLIVQAAALSAAQAGLIESDATAASAQAATAVQANIDEMPDAVSAQAVVMQSGTFSATLNEAADDLSSNAQATVSASADIASADAMQATARAAASASAATSEQPDLVVAQAGPFVAPPIDVPVPPVYGSGARHRHADDALLDAVREKWDAIEQARRRDAKTKPPRKIKRQDPPRVEPAQTPVASAVAQILVDLQRMPLPVATPQRQQKQALPAISIIPQRRAAAPIDVFDQAEYDDEEALIAILLEAA